MNLTATPHNDGTVTITHYGSTYHHWWVGESTRRRGYYTVAIYGKAGGTAILRASKAEVEALKKEVAEAQELARKSEAA